MYYNKFSAPKAPQNIIDKLDYTAFDSSSQWVYIGTGRPKKDSLSQKYYGGKRFMAYCVHGFSRPVLRDTIGDDQNTHYFVDKIHPILPVMFPPLDLEQEVERLIRENYKLQKKINNLMDTIFEARSALSIDDEE